VPPDEDAGVCFDPEIPDCGNCVKFATCAKLDAYFNGKDPRLEEACKHGEEVYT